MSYGKLPPDATLNAVRRFIRTLFWGPDEYVDAMTLILAVTHVKNAFTNVPYALVTGASQNGKSTLSKNIPLLLAETPWIVDRMTTDTSLRMKFNDAVPPVSVITDDVSKVFGESGISGRTSSLYQLLVNGYEDTGKVEVTINRVPTVLPAFIVAFMNGLGKAVPPDLATRAIKFPLEPKPDDIRLRNARSVEVRTEAVPLKKNLHGWAASCQQDMKAFMRDDVTRLHPKLTDRLLQTWGPPAAVAHAAGGAWPQRWMDAFLLMGLGASSRPTPILQQQVLLDTARVIMAFGVDRVFTAELVPALRDLPAGAPYRELPTKFLVEELLPEALGPSQRMTGKALDGRRVTGMGRLAAPVLLAAADLKDMLYPPPPASGPDAVQLEMTLSEAVR